MNVSELTNFNKIHHEAVGFMEVATNDYVACRCCLLNGLFPGLRLGAEAIEKYLKAFVLYAEPSHKVRKYIHGIKDVAAVTSKLTPGFNPLQQFSQVIDRLETHYRHRYSDAPDFKHDASTAELIGIDELVLQTFDSLPIPDVPKFRTYGYFYFVSCPWTPPLHPYKGWLERDNVPLRRVQDSLKQRYQIAAKEVGYN